MSGGMGGFTALVCRAGRLAAGAVAGAALAAREADDTPPPPAGTAIAATGAATLRLSTHANP